MHIKQTNRREVNAILLTSHKPAKPSGAVGKAALHVKASASGAAAKRRRQKSQKDDFGD